MFCHRPELLLIVGLSRVRHVRTVSVLVLGRDLVYLCYELVWSPEILGTTLYSRLPGMLSTRVVPLSVLIVRPTACMLALLYKGARLKLCVLLVWFLTLVVRCSMLTRSMLKSPRCLLCPVQNLVWSLVTLVLLMPITPLNVAAGARSIVVSLLMLVRWVLTSLDSVALGRALNRMLLLLARTLLRLSPVPWSVCLVLDRLATLSLAVAWIP